MLWVRLVIATKVAIFLSATCRIEQERLAYGLEKPSFVMTAWTVAATSGVYGSPRLARQHI
jgi:hypothetical protein